MSQRLNHRQFIQAWAATATSIGVSALHASATDSQDEVYSQYDYIVIGAGSAGSIVAAKLAASDSAMNVLLIEAGGFPTSDEMYLQLV